MESSCFGAPYMAKMNCNPCFKMSAIGQFFVLNISAILVRSGRFSNSFKTFTFP